MQKHILTLSFAFVFFSLNAQHQVWKVQSGAGGANNGLNWADAFTTLGAAIQAAAYGDTIWVAEGIYRPSSDNNRDTCFMIKNGVSMFGGFSGTETLLEQRNFRQYPTILSGDIGAQGDSTDNCYNVLRATNADSTTIVDGFIVEKGVANSPTPSGLKPYGKRGGGLFLRGAMNGIAAAPVIRNCIFRNNTATGEGGAIFFQGMPMEQGTFQVDHCQFPDNKGTSGAITCFVRDNDVRISNSFFGNNNSYSGVLINCNNPNINIQFEKDTFSNNDSTLSIVILVFLYNVDISLKNSVFQNSKLAEIYIDGGNGTQNDLEIKNCTFKNNKSLNITSTGQNADISDCVFYNNEAFGMRISGTTPQKITQNEFINNRIRMITYAPVLMSGNRWLNNHTFFEFYKRNNNMQPPIEPNPVFSNCFFYNNTGNIIGPSLNAGQLPVIPSVRHCSFVHCNTGGTDKYLFYPGASDSLRIESCIFFENEGILFDTIVPGQVVSVVNNFFDNPDCTAIAALPDPQLCTGGNWFGAQFDFTDTVALDYSLMPCSQGVNTGDPSLFNAADVDIRGYARVANDRPEAGAFETPFEIVRDTVGQAVCDNSPDGSISYKGVDCMTYLWSDGQGNTGVLPQELLPGIYFITVSASGYSITDTVAILSQQQPWVLDTIISPASGTTTADGLISLVAVQGGAAPYAYLWSNGATTAQISGLATGNYTVTITDDKGCNAVYHFQILSATNTVSPYNSGFYLSPNPAQSLFHVRFDTAENTPAYLTITDLTGRVVLQNKVQAAAGMNHVTIPVAEWANGVYAVRLQAGETVLTERLLIAR